MAKKTNASVILKGEISPEQHENMIREAAYFRYVEHGSFPGHDLDDWLAAEAELFRGGRAPTARTGRDDGIRDAGKRCPRRLGG